jgi:hypothetical protein
VAIVKDEVLGSFPPHFPRSPCSIEPGKFYAGMKMNFYRPRFFIFALGARSVILKILIFYEKYFFIF